MTFKLNNSEISITQKAEVPEYHGKNKHYFENKRFFKEKNLVIKEYRADMLENATFSSNQVNSGQLIRV